MIVEFRSSYLEQNQNIANAITEFLKSSVNEFLNNGSIIDRIVIADKDSYGNEVLEIQKEYECITGYTNNEMHLAVAKTITFSKYGKTQKTSIVFHDFLFVAILEEFSKSNNIKNWELDVQLFYYLIFHELAHCYDYDARASHFSSQSFSTNEFKLSKVKEHYLGTILSEFAACVFSAKYLPTKAFQYEVNNTLEDCDKVLLALSKKKSLFKEHRYSLLDLAYSASQSFWLILVQFSKLIGNSLGADRNYSFSTIPAFTKSEIDLSEEIKLLSEYLDKLLKLYPVWNEDNTRGLFVLWDVIAKKQGYKFVEGDLQDSLWIN